MLHTKNYNKTFEFVKVIQNIVNFFPGYSEYSENAIFVYVTITIALHSNMLMFSSNILVNWSLKLTCEKSYEDIFKSVKFVHRILLTFFQTRCIILQHVFSCNF